MWHFLVFRVQSLVTKVEGMLFVLFWSTQYVLRNILRSALIISWFWNFRVIPEYSKTLEEADILENAFQIVFAFDEIVALGYRESVNLAQIRYNYSKS